MTLHLPAPIKIKAAAKDALNNASLPFLSSFLIKIFKAPSL